MRYILVHVLVSYVSLCAGCAKGDYPRSVNEGKGKDSSGQDGPRGSETLYPRDDALLYIACNAYLGCTYPCSLWSKRTPWVDWHAP